ncbi:MAG: DMT family transporter [Gammaproteobacteria bacterium]
MLLSVTGFAIMGGAVKWVSQWGIPVLEIVAARALISLILSYLDVWRKGISPWGRHPSLLLARGAVGSLALLCTYYSVSTLPLAEAIVFQYLNPVFTAMIALVFLKERLDSALVVCLLLSFAGLLLVARPDVVQSGLTTRLPTFAVSIAVLGAFLSAVAYVLVKKLSVSEDPSTIIFYFPLVALPVSLVLLGDDFVMPDAMTGLGLLTVGVCTQIGQVGLTFAMQTETAGRVTSFSYLQIVFSTLLGWWVFGEVPIIWTWIGAVLIVLGSFVNVLWHTPVRAVHRANQRH